MERKGEALGVLDRGWNQGGMKRRRAESGDFLGRIRCVESNLACSGPKSSLTPAGEGQPSKEDQVPSGGEAEGGVPPGAVKVLEPYLLGSLFSI